MNTATSSFDTTARQMTEMFQWPKFLSKNRTEMSRRKKNRDDSYSVTVRLSQGFSTFLLHVPFQHSDR